METTTIWSTAYNQAVEIVSSLTLRLHVAPLLQAKNCRRPRAQNEPNGKRLGRLSRG